MDTATFTVNAIGYIRAGEDEFYPEIAPENQPALKGLDGFGYINVLWWLHLYDTYREIVECDQPCKANILPAGTYLRVAHRGTARDLALTLDYAYHIWLPHSDYRVVLPWYVEGYGASPGRPDDDVWDVYLPVEHIE